MGQIWLGQCRILLPYRPLYPTLSHTVPPRSILSRCSTRHHSQPRINFTSLCHALYPLRPTHQTTHPPIILFSPVLPLFHPLPSPHIIPFTSLSLTIAFYLFPSLPIPSHLAPSVSIPFHTFPYPVHTPPYPFHTSPPPPIFSHLCSPITPHSFLLLSFASHSVFFVNPPLSISYHIPFAVFSFTLTFFRLELSPPLQYNHAHPQTTNIPQISDW